MKKLLLSALAIASIGTGCAVLAQTVEGLDLDAIRARSAKSEQDATALVNEVERRGDAFRKDAQTVQAVALEQMRTIDKASLPRGPAGAVDFDEMIHAASANLKENQGTAPQFMVFVSTSMPEQALKRIIADTSAAGGVVVFRGFPGNSGKAFIAALSRVVEKDQQFASIGIDPRLFRAFDVTAVPTMVVSSSDFTPCDGLTCKTTPPPFDRIEGNVTVRYALETFAGENGPGALVARTALANLGRNP
ncbi:MULTISPECIES: type-F conjugative transfer system pilin assembly protein TrbC [Sphingomonadaceae]|jgi:conjugal transfer pilus assembly protein TrbC|uniref:Type-F conjugative transfer system pilin assembly protein TrbC n=1 Tax=Sphingomonas paucimobilis TaxID=13689 RepID=A0A7Y2KNB7_SPHPI|nr:MULTISPECIES: type-F conjugative transfer system pilin assembly protein TrbC [Sphingomonadaceae]MBI0533331.1 type-F conjugative transfer system pilin assembly protein TrbC [Sphingomonas sp. TX0522]MBS86443.1 type-F conjugative transfer system pilin assembly protein TrbC [Sphingobium sp.]MCP4025578.1 type-F conjugative transfer system pilin assembly protein TrbC [Sphingomonas sp.]NNG56565.1 type-F conjugative transfer system pilin assembly protein TrbC [Sphingomonas paucimobilis]RSX13793.1 t